MSCIRIGEASNPGPVIGTCNPSGMLGKAQMLAEMPEGIWGITETHLSCYGIQKFRQDFRFHQPKSRFLHGAPAPRLSNSPGVIGGKASGVALISSYPARNLQHCFEEDFASSRIHVGTCLVNNHWVKCGTFYGFACDAKTKTVKEKSDHLLTCLVERIGQQATGPRVIMGDFNQSLMDLPCCHTLAQLGFVEIQAFAQQAWGQAIAPTSKHKQVRDFVWISRELVPYLQQVVVDSTFFPDHAIVYGIFKEWDKPPAIPLWRKPSPLPWDKVDPELWQSFQGEFNDVLPEVHSIADALESHLDTFLRANSLPGLLQTQKGRGDTSKVKLISGQCCPAKPGRRGDPSPTYLGDSQTHCQWLRQLRRLTSLCQVLKKEELSINHRLHSMTLWKAILAAPGFHGGFVKFWKCRSIILPGCSGLLPQDCPGLQSACSIRDNFDAEFRAFEASFLDSRAKQAIAARCKNVHKIFQDVSKPRALPVQTLVETKSAVITTIDSSRLSLKVDTSEFCQDFPLRTHLGMLSCASRTRDSLTFAEPTLLDEGDLVMQDSFLGSHADVFEAFYKLWHPRWNKHDTVEASRWDDFANFVCQHVPRPTTEMTLPPIEVEDWLQAVRKKKTRCACGPDGISRKDLLLMPRPLIQKFLDLFVAIETTGCWPSELLIGHITAIEKTESASSVQDYRPICVFPVAFRVWASIRAKQALLWLSKLAPPALLGNCPGRQAAEIWFELSLRIEDAMYSGVALSGCVGDVVKAFNCLPRVPVFLVARHLRLPTQLINTWHAAVSGVRRHFVVDGATGPPIASSTGFPEGDPLSVVAMFLLNIAYHQFMDASLPSITSWSYVDNWETSGTSIDEICDSPNQMIQFADMLDLQIDLKKLFVWSTDSLARHRFRGARMAVQLHARDLGGHMCYSKQNTCHTIKARLATLSPFWIWFRRSVAPTVQKIRLLQAVAWPRCLHGIETTWIGDHHFTTLRAAAMKALGFESQGASSLLQFSLLSDGMSDPAFYTLVRTFKMFRKLVVPEVAFPILSFLAEEAPLRYYQGPCGTLLRRLHEIGWRWDGDGFVIDHQNFRFHLLHAPLQLILARLRHAWSFYVGSKMSQRAEFAGLERVDTKFSLEGVSKLTSDRQGMVRTAMNGTFFTRDKQSKAGTLPDDLCVWCKQPDSVHHRYWVCNHFKQSRDNIPEHFLAIFPDLPECTTLHGWWQESHLVPLLFQELQTLPDSTDIFLSLPPAQEVQHIFSDGSCLCPHSPVLRLATWGVITANLSEDSYQVVSQGVVPGILQSSLRAEILGVTSALKFVLAHCISCWLWCDNQQVVDFVSAAISGPVVVTNMQKDHDLWQPLLHLIHRACSRGFLQRIIKVSSHQGESNFTQHVERWAFRGNEFADFTAERARQAYPSSLFQVWERLHDVLLERSAMRETLRAHLLHIAETAVQDKATISKYDATIWDAQLAQSSPEVASADISFYNWSQQTESFEESGVFSHLHCWLVDILEKPCDDRETLWLSSYQLLLDFQQVTNKVGFHRLGRKQPWFEASTWVQENEYDFLAFARNFQLFLKSFAAHTDNNYVVKLRRPTGELFQCWTKCINLQVSRSRFLALDVQLRAIGIGLVKRVQKSFSAIKEWPLAS